MLFSYIFYEVHLPCFCSFFLSISSAPQNITYIVMVPKNVTITDNGHPIAKLSGIIVNAYAQTAICLAVRKVTVRLSIKNPKIITITSTNNKLARNK